MAAGGFNADCYAEFDKGRTVNHVDLFSGIGGFSLACKWAGIETIQFVEIDKRCRDFLSKTYPGVPIHDDIKTFKWDGRPVFLLTAGVPCQPASRAGKQRGKDDYRWLWPEALRVLSDVRPAWVVFENPPGIGDVGLSGIIAQVENKGYEVRVFGIPACAVGAPHRRERYWIVAHAKRERCAWFQMFPQMDKKTRIKTDEIKPFLSFDWPTGPGAQLKIPRMDDGLSNGLCEKLGNSLVPQVAYQIINAIKEAECTSE